MVKKLMIAFSVSALMCTFAMAQENVPSQAKLSKLGLSSMSVVSDAHGDEVRGQGLGVLGGTFWTRALSGVSSNSGGLIVGDSSPASGTFGTIDPNTGVNVPFVSQFTTAVNGQVLVITSTAFGNVSGFAN